MNIEEILFKLSEKTKGTSSKLLEFFNLDSGNNRVFPLSKLQKNIHIESVVFPERTTYNNGGIVAVKEYIDDDLLGRAIREVCKRHPVLKSNVVEKDDVLFRAERERVEYVLETLELDSLASFDSVYKLASEHILKPYDLKEDALIRFVLIRVGKSESYFVLCNHQILMDATSAILLTKEIFEYYKSQGKNGEPTASVPYHEYVFNTIGYDTPQAVEFWKDKLQNVSPLVLNKVYQSESNEKVRRSISFSKEEIKQIQIFCQAHVITVPFFFKAIFGLLIHYHFDAEGDFIVYENMDKRGGQYKNTPGLFLYSHPFVFKKEWWNSVEMSHYFESLKDFTKQTRFSHNISLSEIQKLFRAQDLKAFYNYLKLDKLYFNGTEVDFYSYDNSSEDELYLLVEEKGEKLELTLKYSPQYFEYHNFLERLKHVVEQLLKGQEFQSLNLLLDEERAFIKSLHSTQSFSRDRSFIELFEEQVRKQGQALAVSCEDRTLTYKGLNEEANKLANYLLENELVRPQEKIGVLMSRSEWMLISFLAILKLRAVYVPLDWKYPKDRLNHILGAIEGRCLLTDGNQEGYEGIETVNVKQVLANPGLEKGNLKLSYRGDDLVYIIFTSGSTGAPKGVMIEQQGMMNHLYAKVHDLQIDASGRVVQNASQCFDISIWQFLVALLQGGRTYIYTESIVHDAKEFLRRLEEDQITIVEVVPSYLAVLLDVIDLEKASAFSDLQYLMVTGETLQPKLVKRWFEHYPQIKMVNAYGPTEASDDITHYIMERFSSERLRIPVGKPIENLVIHILDGQDRLCAPGKTGEICVSGIGVGRGYLNDREKTEKVFVKDPFDGSQKMYRTGDVGMYNEDGTIEFFGRKDHQVKVRGHRIELGEIENKLLQVKDIKEAAVTAETDHHGNKYLVAYYRSDRTTLTPQEIKTDLSAWLPDYMVPNTYQMVKEFPLTANGKIDRKSLSKPEEESQETIAPENEIEEQLRAIWAEILKIDKNLIGVTNDFFDLGGDSLMAIRLIHRLQKLNIEITASEFFNNSHIRFVGKKVGTGEVKDEDKILPSAKKDYYSLSSAQKRLYFAQQLDLQSTVYNIPVVLPLNANVDVIRIENVLNKLIERHEILRTSFVSINHEPHQLIHEKINFKLESITCAESEVNQLVADFIRPFDLGTVPLFRTGLINVDDIKSIFVVDLHHILTDVVSTKILVDDFIQLYQGKTLEPLKIQYKDFAEWHNSDPQKKVRQKQEEYWLREFQGELSLLNLPTDYPRSDSIDNSGSSLNFKIDTELYSRLKELASEEKTTLFVLLLSIFNLFLSKVTGQKDITVGCPISARKNMELQSIIGVFTNMLAIRNFPERNKTFKEFLNEVKSKTLQAFDNQDYQYEDLVEKLLKGRRSNRNPLFDTVFSFKKADTKDFEESWNITEQINKTSKFDLSLEAIEASDALYLTFEYRTILFEKATIERFSDYFVRIISQVASENSIKISEIKISEDLTITNTLSILEEEGDFSF